MPEGDTIHRSAARLQPVLAGRTVSRFEAQRLVEVGPKPGTTIEGVEARGKYLLIHFGDGQTLETHMKMTGSWHIYRTGERWRRSRASARAVIETEDGWTAVCFSAPHVKLRRTGRGPDHLGPDLCAPTPDLAEAVRRFARRGDDDPVMDAMLDQRICCGVGNVYKSEVLFACELHPSTPLRSVSHELRVRLVATAHRLLRQNLGGGPRVTVAGTGPGGAGGLAVYGRKGLPCRSCGSAIAYAVAGEHDRATYWCPSCQPAPVGRSPAAPS